jgi:hypothetical protein
MKEPAVLAYLQDYAKPDRTMDIVPGEWWSLRDFSSSPPSDRTFHLAAGGRLVEEKAGAGSEGFGEFDYIPTVGIQNGYWSAGGINYYLAADQRADEAYSLTFTSEPFTEDVYLLGWPTVQLHASSSAKVATFVAKLADVAPDGASALIVDGSINGTRRESLSEPEPMTPGKIYELKAPMPPTGWILRRGHRLRLAISSSDFPNLWPTPYAARNRVYYGGRRGSRVTLPVVSRPELPAPEFLPPPALRSVGQSYGEVPTQEVTVDQVRGTVTIRKESAGTVELEDNLGSLYRGGRFHCTASSLNPAQASITGTHTYILKRDGDEFRIVAESSIRATEEVFHLVIHLNVTMNGEPFFQKKWMLSEPRRLL